MDYNISQLPPWIITWTITYLSHSPGSLHGLLHILVTAPDHYMDYNISQLPPWIITWTITYLSYCPGSLHGL